MALKSLTVSNEAETKILAQDLAPLLEPGDTICLYGNLGAGKSQLARYLIQKLCGEETDVPSPTFTLLQSYEFDKCQICHWDLYRLKNPLEALELGIEDEFHTSINIIEWPDRLENLLPSNVLKITIELDATHPTGRLLTYKYFGNNQKITQYLEGAK